LESTRKDEFYINLFLASHMALCRGEVGGLKWQDINFDTGALSVNSVREYTPKNGIYENSPKTKKRRRTIPMPPFVVQELREEKKRQLQQQIALGSLYHKNDYVCRRSDGNVYHPAGYSKFMQRAIKRSGLPPLTFHELRHSCASILRAAGVPIEVISMILGHANVGITQEVYVHMFGDALKQAADKLDEIYAPKEKCGKSVAEKKKTARNERK
jgi:integrase